MLQATRSTVIMSFEHTIIVSMPCQRVKMGGGKGAMRWWGEFRPPVSL